LEGERRDWKREGGLFTLSFCTTCLLFARCLGLSMVEVIFISFLYLYAVRVYLLELVL